MLLLILLLLNMSATAMEQMHARLLANHYVHALIMCKLIITHVRVTMKLQNVINYQLAKHWIKFSCTFGDQMETWLLMIDWIPISWHPAILLIITSMHNFSCFTSALHARSISACDCMSLTLPDCFNRTSFHENHNSEQCCKRCCHVR